MAQLKQITYKVWYEGNQPRTIIGYITNELKNNKVWFKDQNGRQYACMQKHIIEIKDYEPKID
jgi:hypothetical protein